MVPALYALDSSPRRVRRMGPWGEGMAMTDHRSVALFPRDLQLDMIAPTPAPIR